MKQKVVEIHVQSANPDNCDIEFAYVSGNAPRVGLASNQDVLYVIEENRVSRWALISINIVSNVARVAPRAVHSIEQVPLALVTCSGDGPTEVESKPALPKKRRIGGCVSDLDPANKRQKRGSAKTVASRMPTIDSSSICVVCLQAEKTHAFDCGHGYVCQTCSEWALQKQQAKCPYW
jgi:Zinc finger, C3HC4 type (RING finger)